MEKRLVILSQLASALGRRDEHPNQELAQSIADQSDAEGVKRLLKVKKKILS